MAAAPTQKARWLSLSGLDMSGASRAAETRLHLSARWLIASLRLSRRRS